MDHIKYFCIIFFVGSMSAAKIELRCPLVWKEYKWGTTFPNETIFSENEKNTAIIRANNFANIPVIGHFSLQKGAFIVNNNDVLENPSPLEILVNEYGCDLEWKQKGDNIQPEFLTVNSGKFVGRSGHSQLPGEVDSSFGQIKFVNSDHQMETSPLLEVLVSTNSEIRLRYENMVFSEKFPGTLDFVGIDEIGNEAYGSTISQTVTHRKTVSEVVSFSTTRTWGDGTKSEYDISIGLDLSIAGFSFPLMNINFAGSYEFDNDYGVTNSVGEERIKVLSFERQITVPPGRHVQACTIIGKSEGFSTSYTATGKYTIKGWTGAEIQEYLSKYSIPPADMRAGKDFVTSSESGKFEGSLHSNNLLIVVQKDSGEGNCLTLSSYIKEYNLGVRRNDTRRLLDLQRKIVQIISPNHVHINT